MKLTNAGCVSFTVFRPLVFSLWKTLLTLTSFKHALNGVDAHILEILPFIFPAADHFSPYDELDRKLSVTTHDLFIELIVECFAVIGGDYFV